MMDEVVDREGCITDTLADFSFVGTIDKEEVEGVTTIFSTTGIISKDFGICFRCCIE